MLRVVPLLAAASRRPHLATRPIAPAQLFTPKPNEKNAIAFVRSVGFIGSRRSGGRFTGRGRRKASPDQWHKYPRDAIPTEQPRTQARRSILASSDFPSIDSLPKNVHQQLVANAKSVLYNALSTVAKVVETSNPTRDGYRNTVEVLWNDDNLPLTVASGEAPSKAEASKCAWLQLVIELNKSRLLEDLVAVKVDKVSDELRRDEKHALNEVYEYCIRFGHLPTIERRERRVRKLKAWQTTIALPEQDIEVKAVTKQQSASDVLAATKFKQAAEAFHVKRGTTSLVVKTQDTLNLNNAEEFFAYYSLVRGDSVRPTVEHEKSPRTGQLETIVKLGKEQIGQPVYGISKKASESLAYLVAAHEIISSKPDLREGFFAALNRGNGKILWPVRPVDLEVDGTAARLMETTLFEARQNGLGDRYQPLLAEEGSEEEFVRTRSPPTAAALAARDDALQRARDRYLNSSELEKMRAQRVTLPMTQYADQVLDIIDNNLFSIIIGETGSGKTTQVPQILLDHYTDQNKGSACNVICTQPRRIAATSVATRVAAERGEDLRQSVGYVVSGKYQRAQQQGSINYCTTGILLQQLQHDPDRALNNVSHIVLDEVHERDRLIDYTMIILKQVIQQRIADNKHVPKITLMSATLDPKLFSPYFQNVDAEGNVTEAPVLRVPGRTFPVAEQYLETIYDTLSRSYSETFKKFLGADRKTSEYLQCEREYAAANSDSTDSSSTFLTETQDNQSIIDWKRSGTTSMRSGRDEPEDNEYEDGLVPNRLVAATVAHVASTTTEGAILVFLPGLDEIQAVEKELLGAKPFGQDFSDESKFSMYILHSTVSETQASVFEPVAEGKRKIILSTNITETSVTIPDVQHVIDVGKHREIQYDQRRRLTTLRCGWISKSNAKQRAGRAGRVQNGNYYGLYSQARKESLRAVGLPELLRTDLQETCLEIVAQKWPSPPQEFLACAVEPPDPAAVDQSMKSLVKIEALTSKEELTPLGRLLSTLPIHPELGKMIVWGIIFRCLDPMIILGAAASARPLFVPGLGPARKDSDRSRAALAAGTNSDHIAILNGFRKVRAIAKTQGFAAAKSYAWQNHIHWGAYTAISSTAAMIEETLVKSGLISTRQSRNQIEYGNHQMNENSEKTHVIKALATAGLYPKVAVKSSSRQFHWRTENESEVQMHPGSVNREAHTQLDTTSAVLAIFDQLARSGDGDSLYIRNTSFVSPLAVALFSGRLAARGDKAQDGDTMWNSNQHSSGSRVLEVDDWLPFYIQSPYNRVARTIVELRRALQRMLVKAYADLNKRELLSDDPARTAFSRRIVEILSLDVHRDKFSQRVGSEGSGRPERSAFGGYSGKAGLRAAGQYSQAQTPADILNS